MRLKSAQANGPFAPRQRRADRSPPAHRFRGFHWRRQRQETPADENAGRGPKTS